MRVFYPAQHAVSIWVGTFSSEEEFENDIDAAIVRVLSLPVDIAAIGEVSFERTPVDIRRLIGGFSGFESFLGQAVEAATRMSVTAENSALVCYYLKCENAPDRWGGLRFLGTFTGSDHPPVGNP